MMMTLMLLLLWVFEFAFVDCSGSILVIHTGLIHHFEKQKEEDSSIDLEEVDSDYFV